MKLIWIGAFVLLFASVASLVSNRLALYRAGCCWLLPNSAR